MTYPGKWLHHRKRKICPRRQKHRKIYLKYYNYNLSSRRLAVGKIFVYKKLTSNFFSQLPNKRPLVDTLIAIGNVIDISSVYFLLLNTDVFTFRAEMLLEAICFFVFAITVSRSNQMKEDHWLSWRWIYLLLCNNLFLCQGKKIYGTTTPSKPNSFVKSSKSPNWLS